MGKIIEDTEPIPKNTSPRPLAKKLRQKLKGDTVVGFDDNPVLMTRSRVEPLEVTRVGVAAEALLRAAGYRSSNYTIRLGIKLRSSFYAVD